MTFEKRREKEKDQPSSLRLIPDIDAGACFPPSSKFVFRNPERPLTAAAAAAATLLHSRGD